MKAPRWVALCALGLMFASIGASAGVLDALSREQQRKVEAGESVVESHKVAGSAFPATTVYHLVNASPEEAMAVITDYGDQASYLKACCGLLKSEVVDPAVSGDKRVQRVRYELEVPIFSNETYELHEKMKKDPDGTYRITWQKVSVGGHSDDITGHAVFEPHNGKTILRYFNFTRVSTFGAGLFAGQAVERAVKTVDAMAQHIEKERGEGGPRFQADLARVRAALGE